MDRGFGTAIIISVIALLIVLGGGGYYLATSNDKGNGAESECPIGQPDCNDFLVDGVFPSGGNEVSPTEITPPSEGRDVDEPLPTDEEGCLQAGGMWLDVSNSAEILGEEAYACYLLSPDAGKMCTDSSQCSGLCLADSSLEVGAEAEGICAEYWTESGASHTPCSQEVEGGIVQSAVCY